METVFEARGVHVRAFNGQTRVSVHTHARNHHISAAARDGIVVASVAIGAANGSSEETMTTDVAVHLTRDDAATLVAAITTALAAEGN